MISRNRLILEIKNNFPTIRKPEDYADVLISAEKINALDESTSKRRKKFGDHIKTNAFNRCRKDLDLLVSISLF